MDPALVTILIEKAGVPSVLLLIIIVLVLRQRNRPRGAPHGSVSQALIMDRLSRVSEDLRALRDEVRSSQDWTEQYLRAEESAQRERHNALLVKLEVVDGHIEHLPKRLSA